MDKKPYQTKMGASRKGARHIRSIAFTVDNSKYLDGVPKGYISGVVNRSLEHYRTAGLVNGSYHHELLANIDALQTIITDLHQEIDEITSASKITDDKAQKVPPSRGLKRFFKFLWP